MIVVLPAPVAPTMPMRSPGATLKETSRKTQFSLLYANQTWSKVRWGWCWGWSVWSVGWGW